MSDNSNSNSDDSDFGWVDMDWDEPDPIRRDASTLRPVGKMGEHRDVFWSKHDRDNYNCPDCGRNSDEVAVMEVHHINGNPADNNIDNLVGLCRRCHRRRHKRRGITLRLKKMREQVDEIRD